MTPVIEAAGLTKRFGSLTAVDNASFTLDGPGIHGLLGRNGAGKTTLMRLLTGQEFTSSGDIRVFGASPVENASVLQRMCYAKESQTYPDSFKGKHVFKSAPWFFPNWDDAFATRLVADFEVPLNRPIKKLSRGQRSAIGAIVGLASRAELTLLDEPYAGLDAVARHMLYDHLLEDFNARPRTVLLSTHLIDEAADLFERVLVIDHGRITLDEEAEDLRACAATFAGKATVVDAFAQKRTVLGLSQLGGLASVTLDHVTAADRTAAAKAGLEESPVSLQKLIVHRTGDAVGDPVATEKEVAR